LLRKRLNNFLKIDPIEIIREILSDRDILIWVAEANKGQLLDSKDSNDKELTYTKNGNVYYGYSELYYELLDGGKKKSGFTFEVGDPYNIISTGEFYRSFRITYDNGLIIDANPIKTDESGNKTNLFEAFGKDILGLNEENLQKLIEIVKNKLITEIRKKV
jgi:hypothetical protein